MAEFINLEQDDSLEVSSNKIKFNKIIDSLQIPDIQIENIKPLDPPIEEEPLCVKDCDNSSFYGCPTEDGEFKVENLFSELTSDYQRALARLNLGIGDEFTNEWGNIKGNIINQKDLIELLYNQLKLKADIKSPLFIGIPRAPKPDLLDDSNQIATTNWVMEQLKNYEGGSGTGSILSRFLINPQFAFIGDGSQDIILSWDYKKVINSQKLNGEVLDKNTRSYSTTVIKDTTFTLEYESEGLVEQKTITFLYKYANYFGISDNILECEKTAGNKFTVNCGVGQYVYLIIPNNSEASFSVNGFVGGFKLTKIQNLHDTNYYTYKSVHSGLGKIDIELLD